MTEQRQDDPVRNVLWGDASGAVVQAGRLEGGVHFHQAVPAERPLVPRQLPAPPATFVGRDAELAGLDDMSTARGPGCGLVLITGPPGIGKTALALRWSARATGHFPDGQLYANLGALDIGGPVAPAEILTGFLRALGVAKAE